MSTRAPQLYMKEIYHFDGGLYLENLEKHPSNNDLKELRDLEPLLKKYRSITITIIATGMIPTY